MGLTRLAPEITVLTHQPAELEPPDLTPAAVLGRLPGLSRAVATCLTGSVAAGWGNTYSDIDIYAFSDTALELPNDDSSETWASQDSSGIRWMNWTGRYGDSRVDLKTLPTSAPRKALEPFTGSEPEFPDNTSTFLRDFIYRMSIARAITGEGFVEQIKVAVVTSSYRRALARALKLTAESALTDIAGQLDVGDDVSARVAAMRAASFTADCCLVMAGELCRSDKWLLRRMQAKPECGITPNEYLSEVLAGEREGESAATCAERIARWAQSHLVRIEDEVLTISACA